jgi:peptidoglycan-associated lipoprotein
MSFRLTSPASLRWMTLSAVSAAALLMAGCGSTVKLDDEAANGPAPISTATPDGANANGANNNGVPSTAVAPVQATPDDGAAQYGKLSRIVYFDFDSFVVKDDYRDVISGHAKRLMASPSTHIVIEGNTDDRGGREYNLALGQKRAEAVQKSLNLLGVPNDRMESVSFGEERPAVQGSGEEVWAQNRRAEIKDR